MQIKTIMKVYLVPVIMVFIKNTKINKRWKGCEENGILAHCWWDCKLVQLLWETVYRFLKTLRIELSYDTAIPLLGIYLKDTKALT